MLGWRRLRRGGSEDGLSDRVHGGCGVRRRHGDGLVAIKMRKGSDKGRLGLRKAGRNKSGCEDCAMEIQRE